MAHLLQKVILITLPLAVCVGAAQKRPFSHKYHLTQVNSCQACHKDAETSTKAEDNLLPFNDACATCHDEVSIKEQPRKTTVHRFNHSIHVTTNPGPLIAAAIRNKTWLGMPADAARPVNTKNACVACHGDIEQSEAITDANAKANYPRMADCLVCHNKIDPPSSCEKCHDPAQMTFRPANHTPEFSDVHAEKGKVDKSTCHTCHGRKFTCKGCH